MTPSSLSLQATHVVVSLAKLYGGSRSPSARVSEREQKWMCGAAVALVFLSKKPLGALRCAVSFCLLPVSISHDPCLWQQHMASKGGTISQIRHRHTPPPSKKTQPPTPPHPSHMYTQIHTDHHTHAHLTFNHTRNRV